MVSQRWEENEMKSTVAPVYFLKQISDVGIGKVSKMRPDKSP